MLMARALYLTIYRKWFDEIAARKKKEEYRTRNIYWKKRIEGREYDEIWFRNGYRKDSPFMRIEYKGWDYKMWNGLEVYVLYLGKILETRNHRISD